MSISEIWLASLGTVALLVSYELVLLMVQWNTPHRVARSAHATMRIHWIAALSKLPGSEILAVQTIRNALMSATLTASTAALGLMGTVSLAASAAHGVDYSGPSLTPRVVLELLLVAQLFAALVCSAMAVRYYNHTGFIVSMPVGSSERDAWQGAADRYLQRGGLLYGLGLRYLIMVAPAVAAIVQPAAGPIAAVIVIAVLSGFDRAGVTSAVADDSS